MCPHGGGQGLGHGKSSLRLELFAKAHRVL
jgi:hypothetical protein